MEKREEAECIDDSVYGGRAHMDWGPAYELIVGRSAVFKMADRPTINLYAVGGLSYVYEIMPVISTKRNNGLTSVAPVK